MISPDRWQRVEPILDVALDLPAEDVPAYLDGACAGEPELRDEVERLLALVHKRAGRARFLDSPPAALAMHVLSDADVHTTPADQADESMQIGPYRVLRQLGRGGMGVVYLARDSRLERLVALKLLPHWLAADDQATRRLAEEAKAASGLDHPNIETVFDIGHTEDDRLYIAMAYYEGETLEARIGRGPLPMREAVSLAEQLARGLEAAHRRGIIHRDVKPANVIVTPDGEAKIVDFGVAKATGSDITEPGTTPGTVSYMSPEQTQGMTADARTDLWSLGVVLYEMLAGRRPFVAQGPDAVIYAIRNDEPEPLVRLRPEVPEPLARLVHRCLAKDPRGRYRDATALRAALRLTRHFMDGRTGRSRAKRRLVLVGTTAVTVLLVGGVLLRPDIRTDRTSRGSDDAMSVPVNARLAVLPLMDSSPDSLDPYFADGLTGDLISRLSALGGLRVIAHASVRSLSGTDKSIPEIARDLGVGNVLAGSVRREGEQVQIFVELVDGASQERLWTQAYSVDAGDVLSVHASIAQRVAAALDVRTGAVERRQLMKRGTEVPEAYTEYLKGRYFVDTRETWTARDHFERSLDLDPTFADAWGGLARTYIQLAIRGLLPTSEAVPRARQAAEHALELNPDLAEVHAHLAAALNWYYWDTENAERHLVRAIELDPSAAWAYRAYAVHLRNLGHFEEALAAEARVRELDPLNSAGAYQEEGTILYMARRYEDAIDRFEQLLRVDPTNTVVYFYLALPYTQMGRYEEALAALHETDPQMSQSNALSIRGYIFALRGQREEALRMVDRLVTSASPALSSLARALVYVGLGEHDRALDLIEQAAEGRPWQMRLLKVEPSWDPLRNDPRFQALLERMHLAG